MSTGWFWVMVLLGVFDFGFRVVWRSPSDLLFAGLCWVSLDISNFSFFLGAVVSPPEECGICRVMYGGI